MSKVYEYYVTYFYLKDGATGYGGFNLTRNHKIDTMEQINSVRDFIKSEFDIDSVIVLDWKRLKIKRDKN